MKIPTIIPNLLLLILYTLLPLSSSSSSSSSSSFNPIDNYLLTFTTMGPTLTPHHTLPSNPNPGPAHPFSFPFPISSPSSPHLLRLHFLLTSQLLHISTSHFPLLPNSSTSPTSREFILPTFNLPVLDLAVAPSAAGLSAVELYSIPAEVVPEKVGEHVVEVIRRVNVGGPRVMPENDTMWRSWETDAEFFEGEGEGEGEVVGFSGRIEYQHGGATREAAPESVYGTARALKMNRTGTITSKFCNDSLLS